MSLAAVTIIVTTSDWNWAEWQSVHGGWHWPGCHPHPPHREHRATRQAHQEEAHQAFVFLYPNVLPCFLSILPNSRLHLHLVLRSCSTLVKPTDRHRLAFIFVYLRFVEYQFVQDLFPPNASYEQTNVFLYASAASVIGAIIFSKGAPYRKPLYSNGRNKTNRLLDRQNLLEMVSHLTSPSKTCVTLYFSHHGNLGHLRLLNRHLHVPLQVGRLRWKTQFQDRSSARFPDDRCDRNHR